MIGDRLARGRLGRSPVGRAALATHSRWRLVIWSCLLGAGTVLAATGLLTASGYLISRAAQEPQILALTTVIVLVRFFGISRAILRYIERLVSHDLAFRTLTDLRTRFFERLVPLVPGGLGDLRRGDLLSRFVGDVDYMQNLYLRALTPPLVAIGSSLVAVGVAAIFSLRAAVMLAVMLLLGGILAPALTRRAARNAGRRQAAARAALSTDLLEVMNGSAEIAAAGRQADWLDRTTVDDLRMVDLQRRDALSGGLAEGLTTLLAIGAIVAVTAVAVPSVVDGSLNGVLLAALAMLAMGAFEAIMPLGPAAAGIDQVAAAAARIEAVTERAVPVTEPDRPRALPDQSETDVADIPASRHLPDAEPSAAGQLPEPDGPAAAQELAGDLRLTGVHFSYAEGGPEILGGIDLTLRLGEAVALTGPSGVGKSTLGELLVRFRDASAGAITLDGIDLRELGSTALRRQVRLGPQDSYLFATTIRRNVEVGRHGAETDEVIAALEQTGLDEWIAGLEDGIDTFVGEGGARVSGGQRQRIAAARLFLSAAPFLIFDEPMAHLDPAGAAALEQRLAARAHTGTGVLVITHTVTDPANFDRVLELRAGRLHQAPR